MNRRARTLLATVTLALLAVSAGCLGGGVDEQRLAREQSYDWSTDARATINVTGGQYHAVYDVRNGSELEVYRVDELGSEQSASIAAVKFRYPNGTVVNASHFTVEQRGERTVVAPPADRGQIAFTDSTLPKSFQIPVLVEGSHEVVLPENVRIGMPILGSVSPGGYTTSIEDGRVHIRWAETPGGRIDLQYYLQRDFYIFAGLVVGLLVLGAFGVVYYRLKIRALERRREESDFVDGDADS